MKLYPHLVLAGSAMLALIAGSSASAQALPSPMLKIRESTQKDIAYAREETGIKKLELAKKYGDALKNLEKKTAAEGDLDTTLHAREERESVEKSGDVTSHSDVKLVEVRKIYITAVADLDAKLKATQTKVVEARAKQIQEQEVATTKKGDLDGALALRKEREAFLLEFLGASSSAVPTTEDPRVAASDDKKSKGPGILADVKIPDGKPPVDEDPFSKNKWNESLTVPVAKQRLRAPISIGDRGIHKQPLVVISPRSAWVGSEAAWIDLSFGYIVARNSSFEKVRFFGDLACDMYFINSKLDDCTLGKGGVWYGSDQAAKFYLESCHMKGRFSMANMNIVDDGIRARSSVFESIEFPKMSFKKKQPADFLNNRWMAFENCRFVRCKIPLSILLITRNCVFEDCSFQSEEDGPFNITQPVEVTLYAENCKTNIPETLVGIKLIQKRESDLKGVSIPTISSLNSAFDR